MDVTRGRILSVMTRGGRAIADISMLAGETRSRVELLLPFGLSALPNAGADVVVLPIAGSRDHLVALMADDPTVRIGGLAPGEVGLRAHGQQVVIRADGVEVTGALKLTVVSTGPVTITAPTVVVDSADVRLGSAAASQFVRLANGAAATKVKAE